MNPISVWVKSNILKLKLIALGTIITALVGFHYVDRYQHSQKAVEAATKALNASYKIAFDNQTLKARKAEDDLRDKSKKEQEVKDEKLKTVNVKLDVALGELRRRAPRPITTPDTPITPVTETCIGTQLFREDAEFLTREAARADSVIVWRDYYYNEYENARKLLNEAAK